MTWNWAFAISILPQLLHALLTTVAAALTGFGLAVCIGLGIALAAQSTWRLVRYTIFGYVQFVRNTPLLVQLYFLFFVLPIYGIILDPLLTGVLAIGLHYGTYTSEVFRSGIQNIPRTQWEAAIALNFSRRRTWIGIILPQAVRQVIPALGNYLVSSFKDTPILSAITVTEMLARAQIIGSVTFRYLEPITIVGGIYLVLSLISAAGIRRLGARFVPRS
jgi:polar amino acid transport system permease protein